MSLPDRHAAAGEAGTPQEGGEQRRVVFLPGIGGDPRLWHGVGERLPKVWEKIYLGWSGLGEYREGTPLQSVADMVAWVEGHLPEKGTVDLVAQSMGGVIAVLVASRQPQRVRRLVLAATSGGVDVRRFGATDWRPEYREAFPQAPSWIFEAWPEVSANLAALCQPTLLLWSDSDPISPPAVGRHLSSVIPHASLLILKGGDHRFVADKAEETAVAITRHLL